MSTNRHPDYESILTRLDTLQINLSALRDEVVRQMHNLSELPVPQTPDEEVPQKAAARLLGMSDASLSAGDAGTRCLYKARINHGRKVFYLREQIERHIEIRREQGSCDGSCREDRTKKKKKA
jgi:hypothetical protein